MNKKIIFAILFPTIVLTFFGIAASASDPAGGIHATTRLVDHVFRGVGVEDPWVYIYVINPTWQTVDVQGVQLDTSVNGVSHPELSWWLTPDNFPTSPNNGWDTQVLPFEKSVILWHGWIVGETEPEGTYQFDITVYATVMGEDIELNTRSTFQVFL